MDGLRCLFLLFDPHSLGVSWVPGSVPAPAGEGDAGLALGWPEADTDRQVPKGDKSRAQSRGGTRQRREGQRGPWEPGKALSGSDASAEPKI